MPRAPVRCLLLALAALAAPNRAHAEGDDPLAALSGQAALEIAKALSKDAMKGRKTGFEGGKKAADHVAQAMGDMGLDPKDGAGSYLEPFDLVATQVKAPITLTLGGRALDYGIDFLEVVNSGRGKVDGEVVFVGYGISAPDKGFDEYAGLDAKGKAVLAMVGAPKELPARLPFESAQAIKAKVARERGAQALLLCADRPDLVPPVPPDWIELGLPVLWVSPRAADGLLAAAKTSVGAQREARAASGSALPPVLTGVKAAFEVRIDHLPRTQGHNALGAIRGRDPDLRREVVLVGAHMDGLGVDAQGRVLNGADDNASGTAVLLHVARTLIEANWKPKRMVLFVAFGGTTQGLVGSRTLLEALPFTHDGIVCLLDVDRVGLGTSEVVLAGSDRFPEMSERITTYLPETLRKGVTRTASAETHGDHRVDFLPAFLLSTRGERPNAHTPADDAEHLKPECLEAAAKVLGALVVRLGEEPEPLKAKAKPAEAPR